MFNNGPDDTNLVNRLGVKFSLTKWNFPLLDQIGYITNTETGNVLGVVMGSNGTTRNRESLLSSEIIEQEKNLKDNNIYGQVWELKSPDMFGYFNIMLKNASLLLHAVNNDNKQEPFLTLERLGMFLPYYLDSKVLH